MDEADAANEHIERERAGLLARRKPSAPVASGVCLFCQCQVPRGMRWCDSNCRDDWAKEQAS